MKHYRYFLAAGIAVLLLIGVYFFIAPRQDTVKEKRDPDLLAKVGSREIRAEQFKDEAERRSRVRQTIDKKMLLEEMIDYETLLVKAFEAGLDKDPEIIRSYHNMLIGKLREKNLTPRIESIQIGEDEIISYYQTNISKYTRPAKARLSMIYIRANPKMSAEKIAQLQSLMKEVREKALQDADSNLNLEPTNGFGKLAAEYSEDQSTRYRGGDIGWIDAERQYRWESGVLAAGFALEKPGDISDIVATDSGLYLVKLTDKQESAVTPLEKVKARIRHKMMLEKQRATEKAFKEEMRNATVIETYPENLENIRINEASGSGQQKPPHLP